MVGLISKEHPYNNSMADMEEFDTPNYSDLEQLTDSFSDQQLKIVMSCLQTVSTAQMLREVAYNEWRYRNQEH
jgi:hypothetical protein